MEDKRHYPWGERQAPQARDGHQGRGLGRREGLGRIGRTQTDLRSVERRGESGVKQSRSDARIEWALVASMFVNKMDVDKEVKKPVESVNRGVGTRC